MKRRASLLLAVELAAFAALLCAAVWIRVQSVPQLGGDRLLGTDAFRFFRQAQIILQNGSLPETDMGRWLPTGRDLTVYLSFSSYFLARLTQFLQLFLPNITLYHVAVYYPVGAFAAFMIVCCAFARRYLGRAKALIGALLLAVAPSAVGRSLAGFSDRDALCLLLGGIALFGYRRSASRKTCGTRMRWRAATVLRLRHGQWIVCQALRRTRSKQATKALMDAEGWRMTPTTSIRGWRWRR